MRHLLRQFLFLVVLIVFVPLAGVTQNVEYGARLDTVYMMIGDQQALHLQVLSETPLKIEFPELKGKVSDGIEIVAGPFLDSLKQKDGKLLYEQRYTITSFDSGIHIIPALPIRIMDKGYTNTLTTDSLSLVVNTYTIDESKGPFDIFPSLDMPFILREVLPIILIVVAGLILIAIIVWVVWRYKKNKPLFEKTVPVVPPYEMAFNLLKKIKEDKLWQAGKEKHYYTELTDVIRGYLKGELAVQALEMTTDEVFAALKDREQVSSADYQALRQLFVTADFVKFAKMVPLQDENNQNMNVAIEFVEHVHENVMREQQEQKAAEEAKEKAKEEAERSVEEHKTNDATK